MKLFKNKELEKLFKGIENKIPNKSHSNILDILSIITIASNIKDCDIPGKKLHSFKEKKPKVWSLNVTGNTRILFNFNDDVKVFNIDYKDTH